ncbi:MAG: hypothetical protein Kow001_06600 [Acidobacteriota bacterium]
MKKVSKQFQVWFCCALMAGLTSARWEAVSPEGLTLHKRSSTVGIPGQESQSQTSTMYLDDHSIREVFPDGTELLILHQEQRLVRVNHRERSYSELSFEELQQRLDQVSEEIDHRAAENPQAMDEIREMLGPQGDIRLEKEGPGEVVAGYATEIYRLTMPPLNLKIWAAPALHVPAVYYDSLKVHAKPNPVFDLGKMFEAFKEIDGLSLKTEVKMKVMGMEITSTDEVTSVEVGPVPAPVIPSDYRRVEVDF